MAIPPREVGKVSTVANVTVSGTIGSASVDTDVRLIAIAQTTSGLTLSLPNPSDTSVLIGLDVANTGSASFLMYGTTVTPSSLLRCGWTGSAWVAEASTAVTVTPSPNRNLLINGNFWINQRGYASAASLAAGAYGHDRWKAGTAGAYSFTQSIPDTQINITSGTLQQVVEPQFSVGAAVILSWIGNATARVYNLGASSPPSFAAGSAQTINGVSVNVLSVSSLTAGTSFVVEFGTGTVGLAQLESAIVGGGATPFERVHPATEMTRASRYFRRLGGATGHKFGIGLATTTTKVVFPLMNVMEKRVAPTIALTGSSPSLQVSGSTGALGSANATIAASAIAVDVADPDMTSVAVTTGTIETGNVYLVMAGNATTFIDVSAEL